MAQLYKSSSQILFIATVFIYFCIIVTEAHNRISFYTEARLRGQEYRLPRKWREQCTNLPTWINDEAKSIDLKGQCVVMCTEFDCEGRCLDVYPGIKGRDTSAESGDNEDGGASSWEEKADRKKTWFGDLQDIDMAKQVSSVKPCW